MTGKEERGKPSPRRRAAASDESSAGTGSKGILYSGQRLSDFFERGSLCVDVSEK